METHHLWERCAQAAKKRKAEIDATSEPEETCKCQDKYDLKHCVLDEYPLSKVCRKDVYDQVHENLDGQVDGESFDDLAPNHKRWSLYWYYSVNVFGYGGRKRSRLPSCFVQYVRTIYPDPTGVTYTGFKPN